MRTSTTGIASDPTAEARTGEGTLRALFRRPSATVSVAVLVLIAAASFLGPRWAADPDDNSFGRSLAPSAEHLMGTDHLGRDMLARVLSGGQSSLIVGFSVAAICLVLAVTIGGIAGVRGGIIDAALVRVIEFFQVIPAIILALVAASLLGASREVIIIILALTMWPQVARIMRVEAMRISELGYVESARAAGFGRWHIFVSDIVPNALPPVLVATTMMLGRAILMESGLAFLGLGSADAPSWGALLNAAQPLMQIAWWLTVFPGAAIFLVVLATNILGDDLNDVLNPTLSRVK